jgi:hypothetical protein
MGSAFVFAFGGTMGVIVAIIVCVAIVGGLIELNKRIGG